MFKALAAAILSLWLTVAPYHQDMGKHEVFARWAGCANATVLTDPQRPAAASQFVMVPNFQTGEIDEYLVIGARPSPLTEEDVEWIVAHETAHCVEWERSGLELLERLQDETGIRQVELEADTEATRLLCLYHKDGKRIGRDLWEHARKLFGYEGDKYHGTLAERVNAVESAQGCTSRPEAP